MIGNSVGEKKKEKRETKQLVWAFKGSNEYFVPYDKLSTTFPIPGYERGSSYEDLVTLKNAPKKRCPDSCLNLATDRSLAPSTF